MEKFTLEVESWRLAKNDVSTPTDPVGEQYVIVQYALPGHRAKDHVHAVPLSGIAFRMEMLGIGSLSDGIDFVLAEANTAEPDKVEDVWPTLVSTYYDTAQAYAKNAYHEAHTGMLTSPALLRKVLGDGDPGTVLARDTRDFLRSGVCARQYAKDRPFAVDTLSVDFRKARTTAADRLTEDNSTVEVVPTESLLSLHDQIFDMAGRIEFLADLHAYQALRASGAYYYAGILNHEFRKRGISVS